VILGSSYLPYDITSRHELQLKDAVAGRGGAVIEPDRDHFLYAPRRLAAKDCNGLADSEDMATELRIGLYQVIELVVQIKRLNPAWRPPLDPNRSFGADRFGW
jgi:hypothetical protein